ICELVELRLRFGRREVVVLESLDRVGRTSLERIEVFEPRVESGAERRLEEFALERGQRIVFGERIEVGRVLSVRGAFRAARLLTQVETFGDLLAFHLPYGPEVFLDP